MKLLLPWTALYPVLSDAVHTYTTEREQSRPNLGSLIVHALRVPMYMVPNDPKKFILASTKQVTDLN